MQGRRGSGEFGFLRAGDQDGLGMERAREGRAVACVALELEHKIFLVSLKAEENGYCA